MWAIRGRRVSPLMSFPKKAQEIEVERTGIEPVTSGLQIPRHGLPHVLGGLRSSLVAPSSGLALAETTDCRRCEVRNVGPTSTTRDFG